MDIRAQPLIPEGAEKNALVIDKIDYSDGIKVYVQGHTRPFNGLPTEGAVQAIAVIKKLLLLRPFKAAWIAMEPHILKPQYQQAITRELCTMFPSKMGQLIAHVIEYDSAYRYRIQDLFNESSKQALLASPWKEIRRLVGISKRRDYEVAHAKIRHFAYIFMVLLYIPSIRKAFQACDFTNLQLNENDRYWIDLRSDYSSRA